MVLQILRKEEPQFFNGTKQQSWELSADDCGLFIHIVESFDRKQR